MALLVLSCNPKLDGFKLISLMFQECVYVSKFDRAGADFYRCVDSTLPLFSSTLIIQVPIGAEDEFEVIVDLEKMQSII